ncbi:MAG: hypothetical protein HYV27_01815 [Candidatus Hydrogenedentes bacterium]|nr:hypothetical protein [Candidatus Hydrogenedentota bacterium]
MNIVLLTGPMGSGKSTLAHRLCRAKLNEPTGCIEGDAVSMTHPGGANHRRLDLVERNLIACAHNFSVWGASFLFMTWIFTVEHRMNGFVSRLEACKWPVMRVVLSGDVDTLLKRISSRPMPNPMRDRDATWLSDVTAGIKTFKADLHINTAEFDERESIGKIIAAMNGFPKFRKPR